MNRLYKKSIKISIVMPSYNQGIYIDSAIKSILNQKYPDLELIIIDNLSIDNTNTVLKKYDEKLTIIREKDRGQTNAINKGFRVAKGEILAYLNSDDLYAQNTLKIVSDYFEKHTKAKIVYGKGGFIDKKGKFIGYYKTQFPTLDNLFKECVISQPTVFMRKEVYEQIGPFDENLKYAMDYDYWIRVAKKFKFNFIDSVLASTRLHSESKTSQKAQVFSEILKVLKKNYGKVSDEAIFNYAYAVELNPKLKIGKALNQYLRYMQLPTVCGLKHFGILFRQVFLKKTT